MQQQQAQGNIIIIIIIIITRLCDDVGWEIKAILPGEEKLPRAVIS